MVNGQYLKFHHFFKKAMTLSNIWAEMDRNDTNADNNDDHRLRNAGCFQNNF